jgi:AcrR family transcriptional regulator
MAEDSFRPDTANSAATGHNRDPEGRHPDSGHPEGSHSDSSHSDSSHQDSSHPDTSHPDTSHPDTSHPDSSHSDSSHSDSGHPDSSHPGTRRAPSIRARIRAELTEEIKNVARRHVAAAGAPNLSLRAVARDLGIVSSALYRYYASRDELLTALIIDGYDSLGAATEAAEAAVEDRADLVGRWLAICHAVRDWALANPHEYALIYGSPVPGYAAPQATIGPAARPTVLLGAILAEGHRGGRLADRPAAPISTRLRRDVESLSELIAPGAPVSVITRGMIAWTALFGAVSFELFGRLNNVIGERRDWFEHQMMAMAKLVGLHR